ncbi:MAG: hypothetical protein ACYC96_05530 [Fimbriimonadaceae bacterium]
MTARFVFSLIIGASLIGSAGLAGAQGPGGPGGGGGRGAMMQKRMMAEFSKLKLTKAQMNKIMAHNAHMMKVRQAYRKAHPSMDRTAMRANFTKWRADEMAFMRKTLNAHQFKQYAADMAAMRKAMMAGRRGGGPGGPTPPR